MSASESPSERPAPRNCQQEPPYPGLDTVVFSLRAPDLVAHLAREDCPIETPHPIAECGAFKP